MPSTVVTSVPSAWTAKMRQERTAWPSRSTVQAPRAPCSQPRWVPVRPHRSRRKSASVRRGSTVTCLLRPLTETWTGSSCIEGLRGGCHPGPRHHGGAHPDAVGSRPLEVGGNVVESVHGELADLLGWHRGERLAEDGRLSRGRASRRGTQPHQTDATARNPVIAVEFDGDHGTRDREIAVAAGEFPQPKPTPTLPHRESDSREHFVGVPRGLPQAG